MVFYKCVLILTFITCVKSTIELPFSPCKKDDVPCISNAAEAFLLKTYNGVEEIDVKKIDPLDVPALDVRDDDKELTIHFNNTVVTGLKSLKISDIKVDTDKKSVVLQMKGDISIVSDVHVELIKAKKTFSGHYAASGYIISTSSYNYSIVEKDGAEYIEIGPETNVGEIVTEPKLTLKIELKDEADKEEYSKMPALDKASLRKKTVGEIVNTATAVLIHNIRATAKAFPKESFFTDL